tara:strand:+ start:568 stop:759 length:192 start_codon:yes stop_codon:yes gene_type:complete
MSENAEKIVNAMMKGNNIEVEDAFKDAMTQNVADALETRKQDVAKTFVSTSQSKEETDESEEV